MSNIFKNSYFGKPYKTRGGKRALFQYKDSSLAHLFTEDNEIEVYLVDGCVDSRFFNKINDIVSEWIVDEEKLEDFSNEAWKSHSKDPWGIPSFQTGYKEGFNKALGYYGIVF